MRRFLRLAPARRRLILEALVLLVVVRIVMRIVPFRAVRRWAARRPRESTAGSTADVAWAVGTAAHLMSARDTCLAEAIAASVLLHSRGIASDLHFGIQRGIGGTFAHAWVVAADGTLLGLGAGDPHAPLVHPTGTPDA